MHEGARQTSGIEAYLALDRFLATLEPEERELFVRVRIHGELAVTVAAQTGINVNTLRTRVIALRRRFDRWFCGGDELGRDVRELLCDEDKARGLVAIWFGVFEGSERTQRAGCGLTRLAFAASFFAVLASARPGPRGPAGTLPIPRGPELSRFDRGEVEVEVEVEPEPAPAPVSAPELPLQPSTSTPTPMLRRPPRPPLLHEPLEAPEPLEDPEPEVEDDASKREPLDLSVTGRSKKIMVDTDSRECSFRGDGGKIDAIVVCPSMDAGERFWGELLQACRATGCPRLTDSVSCFEDGSGARYCCSIQYGSFEQLSCAGPAGEVFEIMGHTQLERELAG